MVTDIFSRPWHPDYFSAAKAQFWLFPATLLKWDTANSVWETSDEYSLYRNNNLRSTVQVYYLFLGSINFQWMFSLLYTVHCQKQPPE